MITPRYKDEKLPKQDLKAGRQIFDRELTRENTQQFATVPRDTENPIDTRIRQLAIGSLDGSIDLKSEFFGKNIAFIHGTIPNIQIIKGKIKDVFMGDRSIYVRTRKDEVYVVPFGRVLEVKDKEI